MTQAELDALPDITPRWGMREEMHGGTLVRVPFLEAGLSVLYPVGDDEPMAVVDAHGERWRLGRNADGVLCKYRSMTGL